MGNDNLPARDVNNRTTDPFYGVPWPSRTPDSSLGEWSSFANAYLSSLYWSLTFLCKAPWIGPDTIFEKIFMCFAIAVGAVIFAVLLTFVSSLTRQSQSASNAKREQIAKVKAAGLMPNRTHAGCSGLAAKTASRRSPAPLATTPSRQYLATAQALKLTVTWLRSNRRCAGLPPGRAVITPSCGEWSTTSTLTGT